MNPAFTFHSFSHTVLSWTSPTDSLCITNYTITLTNITEGNVVYVYNTTINTTSMTVSDFTQGAEYSFTVAGVDAGDRIGEKSVPSDVVTVDGKNMKANSFENMLYYSRNIDILLSCPSMSMCVNVFMYLCIRLHASMGICVCVCVCVCCDFLDLHIVYLYNNRLVFLYICVGVVTFIMHLHPNFGLLARKISLHMYCHF